MDFFGTSSPEHFDHGAGGVAPHNAVVDDDDSFVAQVVTERIELELDAHFAQAVVGLDEGAPDVAVFDEAFAVGDTGLLRIADGSRHPTIGHRDDDVSFDGRFLGQDASCFYAGRVQRVAVDVGIRASKVDVLEQAEGALGGGMAANGAWTGCVNGDDFAGVEFAHVFGANGGECATFGGDHPAVADATEAEWVHAPRITDRVECVTGENGQAVGAFGALEQGVDAFIPARTRATSEHLHDDFTVAR